MQYRSEEPALAMSHGESRDVARDQATFWQETQPVFWTLRARTVSCAPF